MKRLLTGAALALAALSTPALAQPTDILNVSYDIARDVQEVNAAFIPAYKEATGVELTVNQSHAGSSRGAGH